MTRDRAKLEDELRIFSQHESHKEAMKCVAFAQSIDSSLACAALTYSALRGASSPAPP